MSKPPKEASVGPAVMTAAIFQDFLAKIQASQRALDEAQEDAKSLKGSHRALWKDFKKAGGKNEELQLALALMRLDDDDAAERIETTLRYCSWAGRPIGAQSSIFDLVDEPARPKMSPEEADRAERIRGEGEGYERGVAGDQAAMNPKQAGSIAYVAWEAGRKRGAVIYTKNLAKRQEKDDAVAPKPARGKGKGGAAKAATAEAHESPLN